jgi:hypothetical protein
MASPKNPFLCAHHGRHGVQGVHEEHSVVVEQEIDGQVKADAEGELHDAGET